MIIRKKNREIKAEINIVPLLDILLVLILIFVITTPMITQNIEVNIPNTKHSNNILKDHHFPVIVEISGMNQYNLSVDQYRIKKLSSEKLILEIQNYIIMNPTAKFLIKGTHNILYNEIMKTIILLNQAGVKSVGLIG